MSALFGQIDTAFCLYHSIALFFTLFFCKFLCKLILQTEVIEQKYTHTHKQYSKFLVNISPWNRAASGARIILTSPDPSSNNALPDTEHESTIFSETHTDTVTFNAHDKETTSSNDDDKTPSSVSSMDSDESASTVQSQSHRQKIKITIDLVPPYEEIQSTNVNSDKDNIESVNHVDIEESERDSIEHTNNQINDEKRVKNDEL